MESEEKCSEHEFYSFIVNIRCDEDAKNPLPRVVTTSVADNSCNPKIYFDSPAGKIIIKF